MPLINTAVPNLIQGVSQQPDATRFSGQCEEQENALSSVADGLKKRPNTRHIAKLLTSAIDANSFVHFINRSNTEKYVVIHNGTKLQAWNMVTGNESSIQVGDNIYKASFTSSEVNAHNNASPANSTTYVASSYTPASDTYLNTSNARENLKGVTVADNTFLLNTTKVVEEDNADKSAPVNKDAFVFVKQGDYAKRYSIIFNENQTAEITYTPVIVAGGGGGTRIFQNSFVVTNGGSGYTPDSEISWIDYGIYDIRLVTNASGVVTGFKFNNSSYTGTLTFNTVGNPAFPNGVTGVPAPTGSGSNTAIGTVSVLTDTASANSSDGRGARTTAIITDLYNNADGNNTLKTYFNLDSKGNGLRFTLKDDASSEDFYIRTQDDLAGGGLGLVYKEVSSIVDLPLNAPNNFKTKIIGDAEIDQDNYYVKFKTSNGSGWSEGAWEESIGFNIVQSFKASSMPQTLINDGLDSFTLKEASWDSRTVGDGETNPMPSFVSNTINNMAVFKDRLVLLSGDNVIFSEAGHFFNFFRNTTTTLLDSAPIDVAVNSKFVTNLKSAVGFQENLILFSDNAQFALKGGDLLTPKTVSVNPITNFDFTTNTDPLPQGSYIYYPFTRGAFTGLREFTVNASTDVYDSVEVTEHVPSYIPSNIIDMAGSSSEDMIALLSSDEKGSLYVYNYFWNNNQKVLSAWSKFTFTGEIRGVEFIESTLFAVIVNNGETNLVEMPLESGLTDAAGFVTHLDMRVASTVTHGTNQITLPYTPADNSVEVYTTDGLKLTCTNSGAAVTLAQAVNDVDADGNAIDTPVFVGIPYTMKYTFSEQLFKAKAGQGSSPSNAAKLMVRNGSIYFDKTAFFKVKVTPKHRDTVENVFTPDIVGSSTLGSLDLDSGFYRFPVFTKAQDTTITIENESALPSNFQSAEFESFIHSRSNRYG
jgi:hypothetical protein